MRIISLSDYTGVFGHTGNEVLGWLFGGCRRGDDLNVGKKRGGAGGKYSISYIIAHPATGLGCPNHSDKL